MSDRLTRYQKSFYDIVLALAGNVCKDNIDCLYNLLIKSNVEKDTLGFWIWDLENQVEKYSPKFRETLGFNDETDFPNTPESWRNQISAKGLKQAENQLQLHIDSKGATPYSIEVDYMTKQKEVVTVLCHGIITQWDKKETPDPKIMVGVHLDINNLKS